MRILVLSILALTLAGCVRTVGSIVTFPVKVAGQGVDWATTSQDESDRNYGRKIRKKEAAEGRKLREEEKKRRKRERDEDD